MNKEQINTLATIVNRFNELYTTSKQGKEALVNVRFALLTNFITEEEKDVLFKAQYVLESIMGKTNVRDAVNYFESLNN